MSEPMVVSDPKVMMGKPVVVGTRITVDLILEKLGSGESIEAVLESHPPPLDARGGAGGAQIRRSGASG